MLTVDALPEEWRFDRPTDVYSLKRYLPPSQVQAHFRDGVFVLGRRAYDQTQVSARRTDDPRRLHLRLRTGLNVRDKILQFDSPGQCAGLHAALTRWLSNEIDDGESVEEADVMLQWEASRAQDEEQLRKTLFSTGLLLCRRLFRQPTSFAIFLLACVCLGLGMVHTTLNVLWARQNGTWYNATCQIDRQHFSAEAMHTVNSGILWKIIGTYEVTVRFEDGCDDDKWRAVDGEGLEEGERVITWFESFDISEDGQAPSDVLDLDLEQAPDLDEDEGDVSGAGAASAAGAAHAAGKARGAGTMWAPGRASGADRRLGMAVQVPNASARAQNATAVSKNATAQAAAARAAAIGCSPEHDTRLDQFRGEHVAYRRLVLDHDDFCYGPKGSNVSTALQHCNNTQAIWMHHRYHVGGRAPCYVFARTHTDGSVEAHVVMLKAIPWDVRCYIAYWALLTLFFLWLCVLLVVRCLEQRGLLRCARDEAITAESRDMLSLAGGIGQPGSALAAHVEGLYVTPSVKGNVGRSAAADTFAEKGRQGSSAIIEYLPQL